MALIIVDIEGDDFLEGITEIYCVSVYYQDKDKKWKIFTTTDYATMRSIFLRENQTLVMHYGVGFDLPAVKKILGVELPESSNIIDTVAVSFALYPIRTKMHISHGLEAWGEEFGVPKVEIADDEWKDLPIETAIERCEQDIRINLRLWLQMWDYLVDIYNGDYATIKRYLLYLTFKMECLKDQVDIKLTIDTNKVEENMKFFLKIKKEKVDILVKTMPRNPIKAKKSIPKKMYKKDGGLSALGVKWLLFLEEQGLPEDHEEEVIYFNGDEEPNPQSYDQVKVWLFSLGWKPITFEERKNTKGKLNKIPQVNLKGGKLCPSVKRLIKVEQGVEELEGLGVIKHRLGLLKSFFTAIAKPIFNKKYIDLSDIEKSTILEKSKKEGGLKAIAGARAFTKTLRLAHLAPIANLPKVIEKGNKGEGGISDGKYIRGVVVAPKGYEICGSDMSSLEDRVKQHFIYPYDPEYVKDMMVGGFDPHLDLAVLGKALTQEQAQAHKDKKENHGEIRFNYKTGNYSCQYGVGAPKLANTLDITVGAASVIKNTYWKRNWAVKAVANDAKIKVVGKKMWVFNPINGFYYFLENKKDIFSALCQGGGAYIFDIWIYNMRKRGLKPSLQYHDEVMVYIPIEEGKREETKKILKESVFKVNKQLKLLRDMDVDVAFGKSYADVH